MARLTLRIGDRRKRIARFGGFVSTGPFNSIPPAITGTPLIPQTLSCSDGTWTGTGSISYARQWLRNGANILGATGSTYTLTAADDLAIISCRITATDDTGSTPALATGVLVTYPAPVNTAPPVIAWVSGIEIGDTMQVTSNGTWTGGGLSYEYQWQRDGADILGATATTYTTVVDDDETTVTCLVTASNSGGEATAASNGITINDVVAPDITAPPEILGTPALGETLTADRGPVTGTPTPSPTGQWYRNGAPRLGQTADTYIPVSGDQGADMTFEQIETNVAGEAREMSAPVYIPYAPIDPATLSPTAWFRPNDTTTVFQTDNGNTPVTAAGQTIGLLLGMDTSGGRGSEILTNPGGPFANTTGWTARNSATLSVVSNRMRVAGGAAFSYAEAPVAGVTVGGTYEALGNAVFVSGSDNNVSFQTSNLAGANGLVQSGPSGAGRLVRAIFTPTATTFYLRLISNDNGDTYDWDYASVREVTGRHARQATSGDRPTYRQGGNGVYYIESVSSDTINWTAPAGTYTVAYVIPDGTVTILTGQSLSGATNIMLASQVVEYIAISGSLTTAQEGGLTAYLEGVANP